MQEAQVSAGACHPGSSREARQWKLQAEEPKPKSKNLKK